MAGDEGEEQTGIVDGFGGRRSPAAAPATLARTVALHRLVGGGGDGLVDLLLGLGLRFLGLRRLLETVLRFGNLGFLLALRFLDGLAALRPAHWCAGSEDPAD